MFDKIARERRLIRADRMQQEATGLIELALEEWPDDEGTLKMQNLLTQLRIRNGHIKRALATCGAGEIEEFAYQKRIK